MSIAFQRSSGHSIHRRMHSFLGGVFSGDRRFHSATDDDDSSSSSSSIGRNSDLPGGEDSGGDSEEVQSSLKGPLDTMDALEEVLPLKKGISEFYNGKSKSFSSLADASSVACIQDLIKPENPYNKKRKNVLSGSALWDDKNRNYPPKDNGSFISKRPAICHRSAVVLGSTMNCLPNGIKREEIQSMSSSSSSRLPPLHPHPKTSTSDVSCSPPLQRKSNWRSFSSSDLRCAALAATSNN